MKSSDRVHTRELASGHQQNPRFAIEETPRSRARARNPFLQPFSDPHSTTRHQSPTTKDDRHHRDTYRSPYPTRGRYTQSPQQHHSSDRIVGQRHGFHQNQDTHGRYNEDRRRSDKFERPELPFEESDARDNDHHRHAKNTPDPTRQFPASFRPDRHHYDNREVWFLTFPNVIKDSDWSLPRGFAGRDPLDIRLWELLYENVDNWGLRHLAHGRWTSLEITKSFKESATIQSLLRHIRGIRPPQNSGTAGVPAIDLETIAAKYATDYQLPWKSPQDKKAVYTRLGRAIYDFLVTLSPGNIDQASNDKLQKLEEENAALRQRLATMNSGTQNLKQPDIRNSLGCSVPSTPAPQTISTPNTDKTSDTASALNQFKRGTSTTILRTHAPNTAKTTDITKWEKELRLKPQQTAEIADCAKRITDAIIDFDDIISTEILRQVAVEWGLAVAISSKLTIPNLVRIVATCVTLTQ